MLDLGGLLIAFLLGMILMAFIYLALRAGRR